MRQAINDALRRIDVAGNMRPSASVLSGYASGAGKPIDGVLRLKLRKRLFQGFASARIASWTSWASIEWVAFVTLQRSLHPKPSPWRAPCPISHK